MCSFVRDTLYSPPYSLYTLYFLYFLLAMDRITIGIDEVGRGALAGPVVVGVVAVLGPMRWVHPKLGQIRDSKKLTPRQRGVWFEHLTRHPKLTWRVASVSHTVIDRINISAAANRGALRAVKRLAVSGKPYFIWLDGGLKLPEEFPHRAIIRGDEKIPAIAAASIIAKVTRDRYMVRTLTKRFPAYGFDKHKGYGTRAHLAAIITKGVASIHRRSFLSRFI